MINNEKLMQIELDKAEIEKRKAECKILFLQIKKLEAGSDLAKMISLQHRYRKKLNDLNSLIVKYNIRAYNRKDPDKISFLIEMIEHTIHIK